MDENSTSNSDKKFTFDYSPHGLEYIYEMSLFNFATNKWEMIPRADLFQQGYAQYLPQDPSIQGLYDALVKNGKPEGDAFEYVALLCKHGPDELQEGYEPEHS